MRKIRLTLNIMFAAGLITGCSVKKDPPKPDSAEIQEEVNLSLHEAILANNIPEVKKAISEGADLNIYDEAGFTPVIKAVQVKNPIILRDLINGGAKIYKPTRDDENTDIFVSLGGDTQSEMAVIIQNEIKRLGSQIEGMIQNRDFDQALSFVKDNYIPPTIVIEGRHETALNMTSRMSNKNTNLDLLKHLLFNKKTKKTDLEDVSEELLRISSDVKSKTLFQKLIDEFDAKNAAHNFSTIIDLDYDIFWIKDKLEVLREESALVDVEEIKKPFKESKFSLLPNEDYKVAYESLLAEALNITTNEEDGYRYDRNNLVQTAITDLSYRAYSDLNYLDWITSTVNVWKSHRPALSSTGYSFDDHSFVVLQALERNTDYDFSNLRETYDSLALFANDQNNQSVKSLKLILGSSSFKDHHKKELLRLVLGKTRTLPQVMSMAIESGGYETLKIVVDSGYEIDPDTQKESLITAAMSASTSGEAVEILTLLDSYGVSFDSDEGADAILEAFKRFWDDHEKDFDNVALFLMTKTPEVFNNIESPRVQNLVQEILKAIRDRRQEDWSILNTVFSNIPKSVQYEREITLGEQTLNMKMSLLWDLILSLYEVYNFNYDNLEPLSGIIDRISKQFSSENSAMALALEGNDLNPEKNLVHGMLPVSLLLSAGAEEINASMFSIDNAIRKQTLNNPNEKISLKTFVDSSFYTYYSEERDYWKEVSKLLIKNRDYDIAIDNTRSGADFYKILIDTGLLRSFPNLINDIEPDSIQLTAHELSCSFTQNTGNFTPNTGLGRLDGTTTTEFGGINFRTNAPINLSTAWTSLGSFEAIEDLRKRTCSGEELEASEVTFALDYILKNYSAPRSGVQAYTSPSIGEQVDCSSINTESYTNRDYYTVLGLRTDQENAEGVVPVFRRGSIAINKCTVYQYDQNLHNNAKKEFLESWFNCAKTLDQPRAIKLFEELTESFELEPKDHSSSKIRLCRM